MSLKKFFKCGLWLFYTKNDVHEKSDFILKRSVESSFYTLKLKVY